jgi:hypothetical protein
VATLQADVTVARATTVRRPDGVLAKLRRYFVHAWVLEETTRGLAEKAKRQDGHVNGDGTTPDTRCSRRRGIHQDSYVIVGT